jgi:hypothetical protein
MIPEDMRDIVWYAVNSAIIKFESVRPFAGQISLDIMGNLDKLDFGRECGE